jgi:hypothetical protein
MLAFGCSQDNSSSRVLRTRDVDRHELGMRPHGGAYLQKGVKVSVSALLGELRICGSSNIDNKNQKNSRELSNRPNKSKNHICALSS